MDLSKDIKSDIEKLINGSSSTFKPCGIVYRSQDRTEYRLSYRDTNVNAVANNRTLALNLDRLTIQNNTEYIAPWELWQIGFQYAAVDNGGDLFMCQSLAGAAQIFKEHFDTVDDKYVYRDEGTLLLNSTLKECVVKSRMEITDIAGRVAWETLRTLTQLNSNASIMLEIGEEFDVKQLQNIVQSGVGITPTFDEVMFDEVAFVPEQPIIGKNKLSQKLKGASICITYSQAANDITMQVIEIKLYGTFETGRYT
jgi:hypothetical protein